MLKLEDRLPRFVLSFYRAFAIKLAATMLVLALASATLADKLTRFDFEDGTLQGWKIISGGAGTLPTGPMNARPNFNFNQHGKYFIGLYESPAQDRAKIVLQSPVFTVRANTISLLVGGGYHSDSCYIALYKASDDTELYRETGTNSETMTRRYWDVSKIRGQKVYIKIVDSNTGGWGHLNADDIRELTAGEDRARVAAQKERAQRYKKWLASLKRPSSRITYTGSVARDVAMPLGGIGGGHVSICGDGAIRQWDIFNKVNEACVVPDSFFAIWVKTGDNEGVARLLRQTPIEDLPAVKNVEFVGEYPVAKLRYDDPALPVQVSLRAYSPFIPMNAKDSALPVAIFEFTIENPTSEPVDISLLSTAQNAAGFDGMAQIDRVWNKAYGGNVNSAVTKGKLNGAFMSNPKLRPDDRQYGTMFLGALSPDAVVTPQWGAIGQLWNDFSSTGTLSPPNASGPSRDGRTWNAAVTVPTTLQPGEKITIPFVLAWHFPNLYNFWDDREGQPRLGRMYNNWFTDANQVAQYVSANYPRLSSGTEEFRRSFYKSSLPYYMLDRISAQSSTLVSTVCMWLEDGSFVGFEGSGCCPMNCAHVWNYEMQLAHLFPELERNMRRIDLEVQQMDNGAIRHRTRLPLSLPRETGPFADGHLGEILKCYREYRLSADRSWLDRMWPRIKKSVEFVLREWDPNRDGVLVNEQWNTYDAAMYGPNTFIGTLYLASLRAAEEMASIENDTSFSTELRAVYEIGSQRLDDVCWNGEYYWQIERKPTKAEAGANSWLVDDWPKINDAENVNRPYGKGCHADQLLGQWWATILDLGYVLPKDRVDTALDSIMKYNWVPDFGNVKQAPRAFAGDGDPGLYNCSFPKGGQPTHEMLYCFEVWTGIEYEVAGLMMQEGRMSNAYQIVKAAGDRYNGIPRSPIARNPWAEVECSNHYARAMSAWSMLLAAEGYNYRGPDKFLELDPAISPGNCSYFLTGAVGWGLFAQKRDSRSQTDTLSLDYGTLDLKTLRFHLPQAAIDAFASNSLTIDAGKRTASFTRVGNTNAIEIQFSVPPGAPGYRRK